MLENEKYKGAAVLQKSYTVDFLTKKRVMNQRKIQKFYIEDDHEAIIEPWIWECVQLEIERRKRCLEEHGTKSYSNENNPFASKIICGECNPALPSQGTSIIMGCLTEKVLSAAAERRQWFTGTKEFPSYHPRVSIRYARLYFMEQWSKTLARSSVFFERDRSNRLSSIIKTSLRGTE